MNSKLSSSALRSQGLILLVLLGLIWVPEGVKAQSVTEKEKLTFSIPKTLYFTGEKIWIDAEVFLGKSPSPSQVVYAELVDANSNSVDYVKFPLIKGKALNYFKIKSSIPSAHYLLRIYTRISPHLDQDLGLAQQFVTIINPNIPPKSDLGDNKSSIEKLPASTIFKKSSKVGVSLPKLEGGISAIGFSVANPFLANEHLPISSVEAYESLKKATLYPELFGHIVEVKVPNPKPNSTYFLSVHGKQSALFTDVPDEKGTLVFDIGGLKHWDRMVIQMEDGAEMPGIEVVPPVIQTTFKKNFEFPLLTLTEEDLEVLKKMIKAAQVENYYLERYALDTLEIVTGFVADNTYNLDAYTRFEDIETVLREYVPSVLVRTRDRRKEFRLLDEAGRRVFDTNPLILVDAMPVFNSELLASFNPKFMQKLEVLNREFYLNERVYPGVLSFSSYENNFGLFPLESNARFFDYLGLQAFIEMDRGQFASPSIEVRIPDWRTILYWENDANGISEIQAPDLECIFLFWVKSEDGNGKIHVTRTYYSIQP